MYDDETDKTPTASRSEDVRKPAATEIRGQTILEQVETGEYLRNVVSDALERGLSTFRAYIVACVSVLVVAVVIMSLYLSARISDVANRSQRDVDNLSQEMDKVKVDVEELKKEIRE